MRSTSKTVLYTITGHGAVTKRVPIGVFPTEDRCRPYAVHVMTLARSGDAQGLKDIGLGHLVTDLGEVARDLRFTRVTLPYDPQVATDDVDPFTPERADAS
jgi:hypothetical protein